MRTENLSALLREKEVLVVENTDVPQPAENEVQLFMQSVGICGSDVHYWAHGRCGRYVLSEPMILGHEASGIVSAVGDNVSHLKVGDRVAIEPGVPCYKCSYCKGGRYNLCPEMSFCATPPVHGSLRQYYCHAADFCFKLLLSSEQESIKGYPFILHSSRPMFLFIVHLQRKVQQLQNPENIVQSWSAKPYPGQEQCTLPAHVTLEEGALLEPLAVGVHSCRRGGVELGSKVLICGAGPVGLLTLLTAKAMGAERVAITDLVESRLQFAKELGADEVIVADRRDPKEMAEKISCQCGWRPEATIECSGATPSVQTAIYVTKSGGCIVTVGRGAVDMKLPIVEAATREIDIRGVFRYTNCYPTALAMVANGLIDVKPLITHRFTLKESVEAFETAKTGKGGAIKVMISCN